MYKIIGEVGSIWFYDSELNRVFNSCLNLIDLRKNSRYFFKNDLNLQTALNPSDYFYPYTDSLTHLTIQLGLNCNYKCIYCSQNYCKKESKKVDLKRFLEDLKNSQIPFETLKVIQFWGGEPLVYWKYLKQIVEFIRKEIPQFKGYFHTTINGSLLTKEIVDFFIKNKVRVQISHDGVNHKQQRTEDDWIEDKRLKELALVLLREHQMGDINITFGPLFNPNLLDSLEFLSNELPEVQICCRSALRCDTTNQFLLGYYSKENIEIARDSYYKVLTLKPGDKFYSITWPTRFRLADLCRNFVYQRSPLNIAFNCPSMQRYEMCFDLNGDFIPCHGSSREMDFGEGSLKDVKGCFVKGFTSVSNRSMCKNCLYTQVCQGSCGMYNEADSLIHCQSTHWAWEAWFAAIWKTLFNEKPVKITKEDNVLFSQ